MTAQSLNPSALSDMNEPLSPSKATAAARPAPPATGMWHVREKISRFFEAPDPSRRTARDDYRRADLSEDSARKARYLTGAAPLACEAMA